MIGYVRLRILENPTIGQDFLKNDIAVRYRFVCLHDAQQLVR